AQGPPRPVPGRRPSGRPADAARPLARAQRLRLDLHRPGPPRRRGPGPRGVRGLSDGLTQRARMVSSQAQSPRRVVVTGLGINTPLGDDLDSFYANLIAGKSAISRWKWHNNGA